LSRKRSRCLEFIFEANSYGSNVDCQSDSPFWSVMRFIQGADVDSSIAADLASNIMCREELSRLASDV
jgi:hypothetical protein